MTIHWGSLAAAMDHAAELARSTGHRQHVRVFRRFKSNTGVVWAIRDADLINVPKKART